MLKRAPTLDDAIAFHESGYLVAARVLEVELRPIRLDRGLRRYTSDVLHEARTEPARAAVVMLSGAAALHRFDPNVRGANDEVEARNSIFRELLSRFGFGSSLSPDYVRTYMTRRHDELAAEAERLVTEHWAAIQAEAANLAKTPSKPDLNPACLPASPV